MVFLKVLYKFALECVGRLNTYVAEKCKFLLTGVAL
jgi:hypothetical protein